MNLIDEIIKDIEKRIEDGKETQDSIAKKINISKSHFTNIKKKTCNLDLYPFIKLVNHLYDVDKANKYIMLFLEENSTDDKLKAAMEYSLFMEYYDLLKHVINICEGMTKQSASIKEWVKIYKEFLVENDQSKIYNKIKNLPIKSYELIVFKEIIEIRKLYLSRDQNAILDYIENTKQKVNNIKNNLIKKFYNIRLSMFTGYVYFYLNNIDLSISELESIINVGINKHKLAHIYHALGLNYFKRDVDTSFWYLKLSKQIFKECNNSYELENVQNSINFISCYANKLDFYEEVNTDTIENIHNKIFREIRNKNINKAIRQLKNMDKTKMSNNNKAFHEYLLGLAYNKPEYFYKSATYFRMCSDKVYCTLPCDELIKLGEPTYLVNAAYGEFIY